LKNSGITFKKLSIPSFYGEVIKDIYFVIENNRSVVMEKFNEIDSDQKDLIKDLICRMSTNQDFKSSKIKYNLRGYSYGEIRPMPHRFFFFQKCGNNLVFFSYILKKKDSLKDEIYKRLEEDKRRYEEEFQRYIKGNR
jgi:hypothetical protein